MRWTMAIWGIQIMLLSALRCIAADSVATDDSLSKPLPYHGAVSALGIVVPYRSFTRATISSLPYRTLDDILEQRTPAYVLSTGLLGDWSVPLLFGESPRENVFVFDGIASMQRLMGNYPPAIVMPEFMEQLDVLIGADAAILAGASGGTAYWVQQPWYNTRSPYTRVWYCQSAYDFIATDGTFSQNVAPNVNATVGFRRMVTPGRYDGQWLDTWNTRALLRWNPSDVVSLSLVHRFTNWGVGTNGGINTTLSEDPTNERTAIAMYPGLNQRLFRHELQFVGTAEQTPHRVFTASIAFATDEWGIHRSSELMTDGDSNATVRWSSWSLRGTVRWEEQLTDEGGIITGVDAAYTHTGASAYTAAIAASDLSVFGYTRWTLTPTTTLRGGGRILLANSDVLPIAGVALEQRAPNFLLTVDASTSARLPISTDLGSIQAERTHVLLLRVERADSTIPIAASAFLRWRPSMNEYFPVIRGDTVVGVEVHSTQRLRPASGVIVESSLLVGNMQVASQLVANFEGAHRVPFLYGTVSLRYQHRIGRNRLIGELFVRGRTSVVADRFLPFAWAYVQGNQWLPAAFDGATLSIAAELGNATVKLAMGNIASTYYATLSTFPQLDRHITLSIAWTFFD